MQGLNDSVTVGVVLTLVFGALFFYLYTRLVQNEKRVSLIESMLIDLKMSADAGYSSRGNHYQVEEDNGEETFSPVAHLETEPSSVPQPLDASDVDSPEDEIYKDVLASSAAVVPSVPAPVSVEHVLQTEQTTGNKVAANYAAMSVKELKALAKQKGLSLPSGAGRKELTDALTKNARQPEGAPHSVELASLEMENSSTAD